MAWKLPAAARGGGGRKKKKEQLGGRGGGGGETAWARPLVFSKPRHFLERKSRSEKGKEGSLATSTLKRRGKSQYNAVPPLLPARYPPPTLPGPSLRKKRKKKKKDMPAPVSHLPIPTLYLRLGEGKEKNKRKRGRKLRGEAISLGPSLVTHIVNWQNRKKKKSLQKKEKKGEDRLRRSANSYLSGFGGPGPFRDEREGRGKKKKKKRVTGEEKEATGFGRTSLKGAG